MNEIGQHPNEPRFEDQIEVHLNSIGFNSIKYEEYDKDFCLLPEEFLSFIKESQPEEYQKLTDQFGESTDQNILKKLTNNIDKYGLIDTLRSPFSSRGVHLKTFIKQPKSKLNEDHVNLYKTNRFVIVRQLHFSPKTEQSVDIGIFLNGIPLLTIELKNNSTGQNIKNAEKQYRDDRDPKEKLFKFNRCLVHFALDDDRVSMTTKLNRLKTRFLPYNKDINNPIVDGYKSEYLWKEILTSESLIDIIENFVHIAEEEEKIFNDKTQKLETKKSKTLIFPRYHQLDVIRKLRNQIKLDGVGSNYLIQHTTGSGKSYEIGWLSHTLTSLYQKGEDLHRIFDMIIVITDRKVLDKQLQNTIQSLEQTKGVVKPVDTNSDQLKKYLEAGNDIIITTIQKFPFISNTISSLGDKKFAVIIDEVHSSQSGERSKNLKKSLSKVESDSEEEKNLQDLINDEIKSRGKQNHISFFGFSGTPKAKTLELFGTKDKEGKFYPFHTYSMRQSIYEGFTLDVLQNYTTYKRYFKVKEKAKDDIEVPSSKGKKELIKFVDAHPETIQQKVAIILDHFIKKGSREIQGKSRGMIIVKSRLDCVKYFNEVNKQLEDQGKSYRALCAFSSSVISKRDNIFDETETLLNRKIGHEGDIPDGLKNPNFRLLIVSNKFQTGFNEPLVQSMYVDKKLGGVQCVQTLSRLNRVCQGKDKTFVLDFNNEFEEVIDSFQRYYETTLLTGETDPDQLYEFQKEIQSFNIFNTNDVDQFCEIFFSKDREDGKLQPLLNKAVDTYKKIDEEDQDEFKALIQSFMRLYSYVSQIMTFADPEIEKLFIFLRYLNKKLPKKSNERLDISDSIDLESLRIQKDYEGDGELDEGDTGELDPDDFIVKPYIEDPDELLSELVKAMNDKHGSTLTDDDRVSMNILYTKISDNEELREVMRSDSSEANKKQFFKETLNEVKIGFVKDKLDFYKKITDDPILEKSLLNGLYKNYLVEQSIVKDN